MSDWKSLLSVMFGRFFLILLIRLRKVMDSIGVTAVRIIHEGAINIIMTVDCRAGGGKKQIPPSS